MKKETEKVILTDVDGVILNWEYAFHQWLDRHGYEQIADATEHYDMHVRYDVERPVMKNLIRTFNESAAVGFMPPFRDAVSYVKKLHEEKGYVFHIITSLSIDEYATRLRTMNIKNLFGETAFERFVYLDTGADKDKALEAYSGSGLTFVEDKPENAVAGINAGLNSIIMEHNHNREFFQDEITKVDSWKEIYEMM